MFKRSAKNNFINYIKGRVMPQKKAEQVFGCETLEAKNKMSSAVVIF
jgi:hypothetical protein